MGVFSYPAAKYIHFSIVVILIKLSGFLNGYSSLFTIVCNSRLICAVKSVCCRFNTRNSTPAVICFSSDKDCLIKLTTKFISFDLLLKN